MRFLQIIIFSFCCFGCTTIYQDAKMDDPNWAPSFPEEESKINSNPGAIYNIASAQMIFEDKKALRVGDIITVVLKENTNASKNADTEYKKDTSVNILPLPYNLFGNQTTIDPGIGIPSLNVNYTGANSFKAETDTKQSNLLQGTITVTVQKVYMNGNLAIKGEKWISLNQGDEFIRISGLIRPQDIDKDNQVQSTKVANARIYYGGTGPLAEVNEEGWLTRFFNSGWWPF
ncbi:MAG: flagellar basal body L-ring protein FlgH [Gammaproteobacteria bacterium]|nr:MAG: flagellar basal body L-ring protein FlgH [Gammaproteobacteria bacterium]